MRYDLRIIKNMIPSGSTVMDLGCGTGELLEILSEKGSVCQGIENDQAKVTDCARKKLRVYNLDFNKCLTDLNNDSFDYVVINNSLQETKFPEEIINQALRIGKKVVIGFPNFAFYKARFQLFFAGRTPMTGSLPYEWFRTPNLRFLTIADFHSFCRSKKINIVSSKYISGRYKVWFRPNLFAQKAIFLIGKV